MTSRTALATLLILLPASAGQAATRAFAEGYETRTGSEGDAQIETWVDDGDSTGHWDVWRVWWGGTASITDRLEASVYVTAAQEESGTATSAGTGSSSLELEMAYFMARYRVFGDGADGFSGLAQLEFCLPMLPSVPDQHALPYLTHGTALGERLVLSYDRPHLVSTANLLFEQGALLSSDASGYDFKYGIKYTAGVAWAPFASGVHGPPFTVGAEVFGDIPVSPNGGTWTVWWSGDFPVAVGPALSFASGRFWATATVAYAPMGVVPGEPNTPKGSEVIGRLIAAFEF